MPGRQSSGCCLLILILLLWTGIATASQYPSDIPWHNCYSYTTGTTGAAHWQPPRRPLILIPGVGGSQLFGNLTNGDQVKLWLRWATADCNDAGSAEPWQFIPHEVWLYQCYVPRYLYCRYNSSTQLCDTVHKNVTIFVPQQQSGICAADDLDRDIPFEESSWVYHEVISNFVSIGYEIGKTLFAFPYDWRQSVGEKNALLSLRNLILSIASNSSNKVDIVTHSMGGLVFQTFLAYFPEFVETYVATWIAACTPFQGSTLASNGLIQGYNLGDWSWDLGLSNATGHQLVMQLPSFYNLLPASFFDWTGPYGAPVLRFIFSNGSDELVVGPGNYVYALADINSWNQFFFRFDGQNEIFNNSFNWDTWQDSIDLRNRSLDADCDAGLNHTNLENTSVTFFSIVLLSVPTPYNFTYTFHASDQHWPNLVGQVPAIEYAPGDGSVPLPSLLGHGMGGSAFKQNTTVFLPDSLGADWQHQTILLSPYFVVQVRQLLGQQCDWRGYWSTSTSPPLPDPIPTLLQLTTYAEANYLSPDESQGVDGIDRLNGTINNATFDVAIAFNCLSFSGTIGSSQFKGTRIIGSECEPGQTSLCPSPSAAIRECVYGFWTDCATNAARPPRPAYAISEQWGHHLGY